MFDIENALFNQYELVKDKMNSYGFCQKNEGYVILIPILSGKFSMDLLIDENEKVSYKIIDTAFGEEYTTFRIDDVCSEYVNKIRSDIEIKLLDVRDNCFKLKEVDYPKTDFIIEEIYKRYGVEKETPWKDDPYDRVFRNKETNKWFALIMRIDSKKLGLNHGTIECMNLKLDPDHILSLIDDKHFFKCYHMNKKYWITCLLDEKTDDSLLLELIEESYSYSKIQKK